MILTTFQKNTPKVVFTCLHSKDKLEGENHSPMETMMRTKANLTDREIQVLGLIAQGMSSVRIAQKLEISFETVKVHRRNMLRKVEAQNTFELIRMAIKKRWI